MRTFNIARKTLLELIREPKMLGLMLLFPAMLIGIYYIAFGNSEAGMSAFLRLLVINQDAGTMGSDLIETLRTARYDDKPVFTVDVLDSRETAENTLRERRASALIIIPPDFSQSIANKSEVKLERVGDATYDYFVFADSFFTAEVNAFVKKQLGLEPQAVAGTYEFVSGTGTVSSDLQFGIPGVMVFGVMFGIITVSILLVREHTNKTIQRLNLTRVTATDLIAGMALAQAIVAVFQIIIAFGAAILFGFQSPGSLLLAVGIGIIVSFAGTGVGLVAACLSRNESQALMVSTILMMFVVFLAGAVFPMPPMPVGTIAGHTINAYDILPTRYATEAMRRVVIYGEGLNGITFELISLIILVIIYLAIGVLAYRLRRQSQMA